MIRAFFDPGKKVAGWAVFDGLRLVSCGLSKSSHGLVAGQAEQHKAFIAETLAAESAYWTQPNRYWCMSEQMVCRYGREDPQDMMDLNLIAGHVGTNWVKTTTWKGNIPKEQEGKQVLQALDEREKALLLSVKTKQAHNAVSAVGIGLWYFGRGWRPGILGGTDED